MALGTVDLKYSCPGDRQSVPFLGIVDKTVTLPLAVILFGIVDPIMRSPAFFSGQGGCRYGETVQAYVFRLTPGGLPGLFRSAGPQEGDRFFQSFSGSADADPVRGTLRYVGSGHTTNRDFNLTGKDNDVAAIESSGTGPLVLNSDVTNPANGQILVLGGTNADNNILSGVINPAPGTDVTSIRKEGPGKWILSGMSQHDGGTTVNAGELVITGTIGTVGGVGRMSLGGGTLTIDGATVEQLDLDKTGGTLNFKSGELRLVSNTTAGGAGGMTIGTDGPGVLQLSGGSQVFTNVTLEGTDDRLSMIAGGTYQFTNLDNSAGGIVAAAVPNVQINGGTFTHNVPSGTSNFRARIQGTGGLTKLGDGILTLDEIQQMVYFAIRPDRHRARH